MFSKEIKNGDVVYCPICETNFRAVLKSGKIHLDDYKEEADFGEL
jgi:uncharacterized Zn finger protein (UPF0148 family)